MNAFVMTVSTYRSYFISRMAMIALTLRGFNPGFDVALSFEESDMVGKKRTPPTTFLSIGRGPNIPETTKCIAETRRIL